MVVLVLLMTSSPTVAAALSDTAPAAAAVMASSTVASAAAAVMASSTVASVAAAVMAASTVASAAGPPEPVCSAAAAGISSQTTISSLKHTVSPMASPSATCARSFAFSLRPSLLCLNTLIQSSVNPKSPSQTVVRISSWM